MGLHPLKGTSFHASYDSLLPQILEESSDTRKHLAGTILRSSRARTARAVSLERLKGLFVNLRQLVLFEFEPDTEVNYCVEVETDNHLVVPGLHEPLLVFVDEVLKVERPDRRPSANTLTGAMHQFFSPRASLPGGGNYLK
jgi:hypothetical protein